MKIPIDFLDVGHDWNAVEESEAKSWRTTEIKLPTRDELLHCAVIALLIVIPSFVLLVCVLIM